MTCSQTRQHSLLIQIGFWLIEWYLCDVKFFPSLFTLTTQTCVITWNASFNIFVLTLQQMPLKCVCDSLLFFIFSASDAICGLVHRKKWMHVECAAVMDRLAHSRCISGTWLQCHYVRLLAVEVSTIQYNTIHKMNSKVDFFILLIEYSSICEIQNKMDSRLQNRHYNSSNVQWPKAKIIWKKMLCSNCLKRIKSNELLNWPERNRWINQKNKVQGRKPNNKCMSPFYISRCDKMKNITQLWLLNEAQ